MTDTTAAVTPADDQSFSVFIREASGRGTTYITTVPAIDVKQAKQIALQECSEAWSVNGSPWAITDLHVLGVLKGDVQVVEWDDTED